MSALYEINKQLLEFEFEIDEETGEILNADELDQLEMERNVKIDNICCFIKNLRADAKAIKDEKDSMEARMRKLNKKADKLEEYLKRNLMGESFSSPRAEVTWRKSQYVDIPDESLLPKKYFVKKVEFKPDKTAISKALKSGVKVRGASLATRQNIKIA